MEAQVVDARAGVKSVGTPLRRPPPPLSNLPVEMSLFAFAGAGCVIRTVTSRRRWRPRARDRYLPSVVPQNNCVSGCRTLELV